METWSGVHLLFLSVEMSQSQPLFPDTDDIETVTTAPHVVHDQDDIETVTDYTVSSTEPPTRQTSESTELAWTPRSLSPSVPRMERQPAFIVYSVDSEPEYYYDGQSPLPVPPETGTEENPIQVE